jgi:hypothetical protein
VLVDLQVHKVRKVVKDHKEPKVLVDFQVAQVHKVTKEVQVLLGFKAQQVLLMKD